MPSYNPSQTYLLLNENSSYLLEVHNNGLTLFTLDHQPLFELNEPVFLAQGTIDDSQQIHLAYIKNSGELCYSIILSTGHHQTMPLGKLDIRNQRYDRLFLFPVGKVIHIFYASAHYGLPDVWRITHLFWNGQTWKSAQIGEVVHPRSPLYQVLIDSRSNLHVLMMTYLGNRSILLSSMFNGSFYLWSKRQEVLSIPREVVDMTALITSQDEGHLFWAAKQAGSDRFEVGHGVQGKMHDFKSSWRTEALVATNLEGPWQGLGAIQSQGILSVLVNINQAAIFQFQDLSWKPVLALRGDFSHLQISQKAEGITSYTHWLRQEGKASALFARELSLGHEPPSAPFESTASPSLQNPSPFADAPSIAPTASYNAAIAHNANPQAVYDGSSSQEVLYQGNHPQSSRKSEPTLTRLIHPLATSEPATSLTSSAEKNSSDLSVPASSQGFFEDQSSTDNLTQIFSNLKETTTSITSNLENLSQKIDSLPEVLELLKELKLKNEQALGVLQQLESKVNQIQTQKEVASKKGFWQRWLT